MIAILVTTYGTKRVQAQLDLMVTAVSTATVLIKWRRIDVNVIVDGMGPNVT